MEKHAMETNGGTLSDLVKKSMAAHRTKRLPESRRQRGLNTLVLLLIWQILE
jgi:hypothetical protein